MIKGWCIYMRLSPVDRRALVEAALGKRPMDIVIKNVNLVNVFTGEVYPASVGIYDGFIAHVDANPDSLERDNMSDAPMEGTQEFDGQGMYLIPGLIDSHVHIESSMMTPANFAAAVIPNGTITVITDPHEIANVLGMRGVRYMLDNSKNLPMRQFVLVPSCVPSAPGLEKAGASIGPEQVSEMLGWDRVLGLAEVMDFPGVVYGSDRMVQILKKAEERGAFIQGHSPTLSGRMLSAYICAGPKTDHEITTAAEAREKMRLGMTMDARESSIAQNLATVLPAVKDFKCPPNLTLCTDDREADDLLHQGHMNYVLQRAIEQGMEPVEAIRCATLNAAKSAGLNNLGAIAPGYVADLVLLPSLTDIKPAYVFFEGRMVAKHGSLTVDIPSTASAIDSENTVYLPDITEQDFVIKAPVSEGSIKVRVIVYVAAESLFTDFKVEAVPVKDGMVDISEIDGLNYIAVFNRHSGIDNRAIGLIRDFGIDHGAIASTVSHDCHNLTVVASNARDAAVAAQALKECGGGLVCVRDGKVLSKLELPIAGLMSRLGCRELAKKIAHLKDTLKDMGMPGQNPLLRIATLTLAVIPKAKITDMGLVSVLDQQFVDLFWGQA
jgi:adenine deaminase